MKTDQDMWTSGRSTVNLRAMGAMKPRQIPCLAMVGLTVLLAGCAHTPSSPLPEATQPQLGKIGVVVKSAGEGNTLETPRTGWVSNLGRGAAVGAGRGAVLGYIGILCGYYMVVCVPGLALAGAIPGSIAGGLYGALKSESLSNEGERALDTALTDTAFEDVILSQTIASLRENGYEIDKLAAGTPRPAPDESSDPASPPDSVDTILEIRDLVVRLAPTEFAVNPPRRVILSAQIRMIRTADDTVLDDRRVTVEPGTIRSLAEWTADDANNFREEVSLKAHRLGITISEQIVEQFPASRVSMNTN
ncbi:MAG: hypothetical protein HY038_05475 [Nitrospirae bacterium]|nr:hypothetical protein [Nitrospirota bacterium]